MPVFYLNFDIYSIRTVFCVISFLIKSVGSLVKTVYYTLRYSIISVVVHIFLDTVILFPENYACPLLNGSVQSFDCSFSVLIERNKFIFLFKGFAGVITLSVIGVLSRALVCLLIYRSYGNVVVDTVAVIEVCGNRAERCFKCISVIVGDNSLPVAEIQLPAVRGMNMIQLLAVV